MIIHFNQISDNNQISNITVKVEPRRLHPAYHFSFSEITELNRGDPIRNLGYSLVYTAGFREVELEGQKYIVSRIPFSILRIDQTQSDPIRINLSVQKNGTGNYSWLSNNPITPRLVLGSDNPAELGWLTFG